MYHIVLLRDVHFHHGCICAEDLDVHNDLRCRLLLLLEGIEAKINLIVFNPHQGTRFQPSEPAVVSSFRSQLIQGGRVCTLRDSRGDDGMAACGQLGDASNVVRKAPTMRAPSQLQRSASQH